MKNIYANDLPYRIYLNRLRKNRIFKSNMAQVCSINWLILWKKWTRNKFKCLIQLCVLLIISQLVSMVYYNYILLCISFTSKSFNSLTPTYMSPWVCVRIVYFTVHTGTQLFQFTKWTTTIHSTTATAMTENRKNEKKRNNNIINKN